MRDGQLDTAASYLIILQNTESAAVSLEVRSLLFYSILSLYSQQSSHLLREALSSCSWQLARDLVRFASSIDAGDLKILLLVWKIVLKMIWSLLLLVPLLLLHL